MKILFGRALWRYSLAALYEDTLWPPNGTFNAQKSRQGELARRQGWLYLILSTTINQKVRKKIRDIGTLNYNFDCDCPIELSDKNLAREFVEMEVF